MNAVPYFTPDRAFVGTYPALPRRLLAGAIDWTLCYFAYLIASIPLGIVQAVGRVSLEAGDLGGVPGAILFWAAQGLLVAPVVAYFALLWPSGSTLGMRAVGIELVVASTGGEPSPVRSGLRALLAALFGVATYVLSFVVLGDPPLGGYSSADLVAAYASAAVVGACVLGKLWLLVDPARRSIWDRLFGLLYVEDLVATDESRGSRFDLWLSERSR